MADETPSLNGLKKNSKYLTHNQLKQLIEKDHPNITIKRQAELLDIYRSSLYYKSKISQKNIEIMHLIDKIYTDYPFYGSRRIKKELKTYHGIKVSRQKVQRMMRIMGLNALAGIMD